VISDMEGVAGVVKWEQVDGGESLFEEARKLYTEEINAAVRGAKAAGATEIVVMDCHGAGKGWTFNSLVPELLDPALPGRQVERQDPPAVTVHQVSPRPTLRHFPAPAPTAWTGSWMILEARRAGSGCCTRGSRDEAMGQASEGGRYSNADDAVCIENTGRCQAGTARPTPNRAPVPPARRLDSPIRGQ